MRTNHIAAIWLIGAAAAVAVYLLGSDWLLGGLADLGSAALSLVNQAVRQLSLLTAGLLRALAIGLFVTFVGLTLLAIRAGHKGRLALVLVSAGFLWLVGFGDWASQQGASQQGASREDWVEALMLAAAGALVMTQRLLRTPRPG